MRAVRAVIPALCAMVVAARADAQSFNAMKGNGPNDVWAVGDLGLVTHFNGQGWMTMASGTRNTLRDVYPATPTDVWVVGDESTILRLAGNRWTWVQAPVRGDFVAVNGCGPTDVWVVAQSEEAYAPPVLLHWNGSAWSVERAPVSFRPAGIARTCATVTGAGGPGITLAGSTFFDPRPDQRRTAGVLMRRTGSTWTTSGWDGRAINDPQLGNTAWTSITGSGNTVLLAGRGDNGPVTLLGRGNAWTTLPAPDLGDADASSLRLAVGSDGVPVMVYEKGFGRLVNGRWAITTVSDASQQMGNDAMMARYQALAQQMQQQMARGQQPTQEQIRQLQAMSQQATQQMQSGMAQVQRAQSMAFGDEPAVFAPTSREFFVTSSSGQVFRVRGDSSEVVWNANCSNPAMQGMDPCSSHLAQGVQPPMPAQGAQPRPLADQPAVQQQNQPAAAPATKRLINPPRGLPRRP